MQLPLSAFALSFVLSLILVPACRRLAHRFGRVAHPREDRWHRRPVALLGGVGIAASLFITAGALGLAAQLPVIVICSAFIAVTGLVDDLVTIKPTTKLVIQISLASALLFFDYRLHWVNSITIDSVLTLLWLVGITNAFNLLDNMDGLCGGIAVIVAVGLLVDATQGAGAWAPDVAYLAALIGAVGGFLVFNVHPASIFMGDTGSLLLGFSFGALVLSAGHEPTAKSNLVSAVAVPVLVLLIPILDTTLVTVSRWTSGRSASQGGRDHTSHRLVALGLSEPRAVAMLWVLSGVAGATSLLLTRFNPTWSLPAAGAFVLGMVVFAVYLGGIRVYDESSITPRTRTFTPLVVELMYKRRVAEVLLDLCLITASYYVAYRLRFEGPYEFLDNFRNFSSSLPVVLASQMIAFFAVGVYRGVWRYFSLTDALVVARGVFVGVVSSQLVILYLYRFFSYSRAVFVIYAILLTVSVILSRVSLRLVGEFLGRQRETGIRVVIYGAGDGGAIAVRELLKRPKAVRILGFIDDAPHRTGTRVLGYPVLGDFDHLIKLMSASALDLVVISAQNMDPDRVRTLRLVCASRTVALTRLTIGMEDLIVPFDSSAVRSGISPSQAG